MDIEKRIVEVTPVETTTVTPVISPVVTPVIEQPVIVRSWYMDNWIAPILVLVVAGIAVAGYFAWSAQNNPANNAQAPSSAPAVIEHRTDVVHETSPPVVVTQPPVVIHDQAPAQNPPQHNTTVFVQGTNGEPAKSNSDSGAGTTTSGSTPAPAPTSGSTGGSGDTTGGQ